MFSPLPTGLWRRIVLPMVVFVAIGSLGIVLWLEATARSESRAAFLATARANADFIQSARLPVSERTAESLGRVLGVAVFLIPTSIPAEEIAEYLRAQGAQLAETTAAAHALRTLATVVSANELEAVAIPVSATSRLVLVRPRANQFTAIAEPRNLTGLVTFWLLCLGLALVIARGVVRPLRQLTECLPQTESDPAVSLPGADRPDEIGQLVRAYLDTRRQLSAERAEREKAERMALLGRMATGLAHEIHNPLSAIRMHGQLAQSAPPEVRASTIDESLPVILSETAKIEDLVNQWMFLAKPEPPQTSAVDLRRIIAELLRAHAPLAMYSGVTFESDLPEGCFVNADARRLSQALGNIIVNSIQAMAAGGGALTITASCGDDVELVFRDFGPGFSAEALRRHRELFYTEKEGGMGIGLSVTGEILRAHAGRLTVENHPAGGAIITVRLPASSPASTPAPLATKL